MGSLLADIGLTGLGSHEIIILLLALVGYTLAMLKGFSSVKSDIRNLKTSLDNDRRTVARIEDGFKEDMKETKTSIALQFKRLDAISKGLTRHGGKITENSEDIKGLREKVHHHADQLQSHTLKLHSLGK